MVIASKTVEFKAPIAADPACRERQGRSMGSTLCTV